MVYVIQVCWQLASRIRTELQFRPDAARKPSTKLCDIYHCCVYSEKLLMMDRETVRNMQFYSKNKFEKLVYLFRFIIRIYHDARSPERQIELTHIFTVRCIAFWYLAAVKMVVYFALFERIWHERLCTKPGPVLEGRKDARLGACVHVIRQLKPKYQSQLIYTDKFRSV